MDPQRVCEALAPWVSPHPGAPVPYVGRLWVGGFELRPQIRGRNSFIPFARAVVQPELEGSHVSVTMQMGAFTRVFMAVWLTMAFGFMAIATTMAIVTAAHGEYGGVVVFGGLFLFASSFPVFGVWLSRYGFRKEADPLERFLRETLYARPVPPYR